MAVLAVGLLGCMRTPPPLPAELAQAQQREGSPEAAIADYEALYARCQRGAAAELVAHKDDCGTVAFRLAQSLEQAERYADAARVFSSVPALSRDRVKVARAKVRAALLQAEQLGAAAEALRLCREVIAEAPGEIPAEDALGLLVRLRSAAPAAGDVAGDLPTELDRLAETLRPHETIASLALLYGAQAAERRDQPAEALRRYDAIWQRYPRGPLFDDSLLAAARLLQKLQRSAEAAQRLTRLQQGYTKALVIGHYHQEHLIESMLLLGQIYLRDLNRPEQAISTLKQLLTRQPDSVLCDDALLLMAQAALRLPPPSPAHRTEACGYLGRLLTGYPDSNHRRAALALQREQDCR